MWSKPNSKNSTAKKSAENKNKSAVSSRKQRILWSCYPDLNWGPHPYQRRRKNFFNHKHHKTKNFRRAIQLLRCQEIATGGPAPCFFMPSNSFLPPTSSPCPAGHTSEAIPTGQRPRALTAHRRGIAPSGHTFGPALCHGNDNRPPVPSWRAPTPRPSTNPLYR